MYGRLSVFLSLLVFACAVPINLRELENVLYFVIDEIAVEGVLSNRDHLPTPPPMPEPRSNYKKSNGASRDLYSRLSQSQPGTLDNYGSVSEITLQVTVQHPIKVTVQEVAVEVPVAAPYAPVKVEYDFRALITAPAPAPVAHPAPAPVKIEDDFPARISAPAPAPVVYAAPAPVKVEHNFPGRISAPAHAPVVVAARTPVQVKISVEFDFPAPISAPAPTPIVAVASDIVAANSSTNGKI